MASYFPDLDQLDKVDEQTYGWVLHKIGNEAYKHRVEYTSRWQWHHEDRKITWEPIEGRVIRRYHIFVMCSNEDRVVRWFLRFKQYFIYRYPVQQSQLQNPS